MSKAKLTISIDPELAEYLRSTPSVSSTIAEAVAEYRARELEVELEAAYREDAAESERLNREWEPVDTEVCE
jgi:hypothetical protein